MAVTCTHSKSKSNAALSQNRILRLIKSCGEDIVWTGPEASGLCFSCHPSLPRQSIATAGVKAGGVRRRINSQPARDCEVNLWCMHASTMPSDFAFIHFHLIIARHIDAVCCVRLKAFAQLGREIFRTIRLTLGIQFVPPNIFPDRAKVSVGMPRSCFIKTSRSHGFFVRPMEYFCRSDR